MSTGGNKKIVTLAALGERAAAWKADGKTIALCHGVFDLLHPGHVRHLEAAAREADVLVITITADSFVNKGPGRPVFPDQLRAEVLAAFQCVGLVAIHHAPTAVEAIHAVRPHVYVKGSDYKDVSQDLTGKIADETVAVQSHGGRVVYTDDIVFSSSSLVNEYFFPYPDSAAEFLRQLRESARFEALQQGLESARSARVLVIGDAIIDEYHYCTPLGKSPKGDVINTRHLSAEMFAGGVLATANHLADFCERVDLVTCLGDQDSREDFIRAHLKPNVHPKFFQTRGLPTVVKRRFVEPGYMRKLFEVSFFGDDGLRHAGNPSLTRHLAQIAGEYDVVLAADFGHGVMDRSAIEAVCQHAQFLAVNAQTNSANIGFNLVTKYPRADYICVDELEARLASQDQRSQLETIIVQLATQLGARGMAITHGHHGCLIYSEHDGVHRIPALTNKVVDTVGAGDAFLALSTLCMAVGLPVALAGLVGNAAGAMHVGSVCNRQSIEKIALLKFLATLFK